MLRSLFCLSGYFVIKCIRTRDIKCFMLFIVIDPIFSIRYPRWISLKYSAGINSFPPVEANLSAMAVIIQQAITISLESFKDGKPPPK